jgi:hypothetical protein
MVRMMTTLSSEVCTMLSPKPKSAISVLMSPG